MRPAPGRANRRPPGRPRGVFPVDLAVALRLGPDPLAVTVTAVAFVVTLASLLYRAVVIEVALLRALRFVAIVHPVCLT